MGRAAGEWERSNQVGGWEREVGGWERGSPAATSPFPSQAASGSSGSGSRCQQAPVKPRRSPARPPATRWASSFKRTPYGSYGSELRFSRSALLGSKAKSFDGLTALWGRTGEPRYTLAKEEEVGKTEEERKVEEQKKAEEKEEEEQRRRAAKEEEEKKKREEKEERQSRRKGQGKFPGLSVSRFCRFVKR